MPAILLPGRGVRSQAPSHTVVAFGIRASSSALTAPRCVRSQAPSHTVVAFGIRASSSALTAPRCGAKRRGGCSGLGLWLRCWLSIAGLVVFDVILVIFRGLGACALGLVAAGDLGLHPGCVSWTTSLPYVALEASRWRPPLHGCCPHATCSQNLVVFQDGGEMRRSGQVLGSFGGHFRRKTMVPFQSRLVLRTCGRC